jgi:hypothetical protein
VLEAAVWAVSEQVPAAMKVTVRGFETVHTDVVFDVTDAAPSPVAWLTVAVYVPPYIALEGTLVMDGVDGETSKLIEEEALKLPVPIALMAAT